MTSNCKPPRSLASSKLVVEDQQGASCQYAGRLVHAASDGCSRRMGFTSWRNFVVLSKSFKDDLKMVMNAGSNLTPYIFSMCADNSTAETSPISATARRKTSIGFIDILQVGRENSVGMYRQADRLGFSNGRKRTTEP